MHVATQGVWKLTYELEPWKLEAGATAEHKDLTLCFTKSDTADESFSIFDQEITLELDLRDFGTVPSGYSRHLRRITAIPYFSEQALVMTLPSSLFPSYDCMWLNFLVSCQKLGDSSFAIREESTNIEEMVCRLCT